MSSTSASSCDGKEMGVQPKAGLRQQLKRKVSDNLSARGVSTADRWSSRPKAKLTKEEQERLDRQRYNKRKWAQKERARCKKELEDLKDKNADLELQNDRLKKYVERLRGYEVGLKTSLVDHQCKFKGPPPPLLKVVYVPSTKKWTDVENGETISIVVGEDGILRHAERSASSSQTHRLRLTSEGEEETVSTVTPASEFRQIEGTNIVINNGKYYQLNPLPSPVLSTPKPTMSFSGKVGLSGGQVYSAGSKTLAGTSSVNGLQRFQSGEVQMYAEAREKSEGQTLSSGGFSLEGMACGGRSFMEMLQEDDKGEEREGEGEVTILEDTLRIKMEPPEVMEEVEIDGSGMQEEGIPYSQGIMLPDTAGPALSSTSGVIPSAFSESSQSDDSQTRLDASCNGYEDSGGYSDSASYKKSGRKRSTSDRRAFDGETEGGGQHSSGSFSKKGKKTVVDPWAVAPVSEPDQAGRWRPSESAMAEFHSSNEGSNADPIFTDTSAAASSDAASPARFTTLTNMEIPSCTASISDSVTLVDSNLTLDELSNCEIVEVTVKSEPDTDFEFKQPDSGRRAPLTRLQSWPGLPQSPSPARRTRHTSFPAPGLGEDSSKAGLDGDTDEDIVENAIAAAREAELRSSTSSAVSEADAAVTYAIPDEAATARPLHSRCVPTTSSSTLVAAEEIPRSPTSPTSPAPTSPFRARVAIESPRRVERDGDHDQQLMIVEDGGEQRLVLQSLGSTPA